MTDYFTSRSDVNSLKFAESKLRSYYITTSGSIVSRSKKTGKKHVLKLRKNHNNSTVNINRKNVRVDSIVITSFFQESILLYTNQGYEIIVHGFIFRNGQKDDFSLNNLVLFVNLRKETNEKQISN